MSIELTQTTIVRLPSGVRLKKDEVRDRFVLLAPERAVVVDPIAVAILNEIDGVKTFDAIIKSLAAKFAADPQVITSDVRNFILDLSNRRMVELQS
jgi:pyrroloquinoline quinone biosynthesis protein D